MKREELGARVLADWDGGWRTFQGGASRVHVERVRFDGLTEFLKHVEKRSEEHRPLKNARGRIVNMLTDDEDRMDDGAGASYAETRLLAHKGWKEGLKEARSIVRGMVNKTPMSKAIRHFLSYAVCGGIPDVGAFLSSEPEHFLHIEPQIHEGMGRIAKFRVCACAGNIDVNALLVRGLIIIGAIEALESQGMSVELDFVAPLIYAEQGYRTVQIEIPLKQADRVGDPSRIVFCVAHPSFVRRYVYREAQFYTESRTQMGNLWGDLLAAKNDLVLNPLMERVRGTWTPEKASEFVARKIGEKFHIF